MSKRKSMEMWIREALTDTDKDGKCTMLALVHMQGQIQKEIHTTKFNGGSSFKEDDLGRLFRGKAETYCQDIPGVQTFQLLAFYGDRPAPEAFFPFRINVDEGLALGTLGSEAPTEQGRLAQIMRREDSLLGQVYRRQQIMDDWSLRLIQQLSSANEKLMQENRDAFDVVKDMLMKQALDMHTRQMEAMKFERDTVERKKWMSMIPMLVNTLTGKEIFPQASADTALLEGIADKLTPESIQQLAGVLPPEMIGPLMARLMEYERKKEKEEIAAAELRQLKSPDPENDAAGDVVRMGANGLLKS